MQNGFYSRLDEKWGSRQLVDSFSERGFKDGTWKHKSDFNDHKMAADGQSAILYLSKRPEIDSKRIGVMGRSLGGGASVMMALQPWRDTHRVSSVAPVLAIGLYPA